MTTYKNRLPPSALMGYISPAPHKTGAGIGTPLDTKAHNRASGFFTCDASPQPFRIMAGRMGELKGSPVSFVPGSSNPVRLATQSLEPLSGELTSSSNKGYPSWQTVNNASARAAIRSRASTLKPKSTADCTAPTIWRSSCVSKCLLNPATAACYGCRQFWTTSPTISAIFNDCLTSQRTPRNAPPMRPCSSGAFMHPVNREVRLWP
ncbi:ash family protein [Salmonella enterica]|nr:ash family protein [Salmonella enterica]EFR2616387.1 ash family protein [Salmonella enterica]EHJ0802547.1 ash family protein [Salmonella enterica]EJH2873288.1 ash family protein [Salmonella enterica]